MKTKKAKITLIIILVLTLLSIVAGICIREMTTLYIPHIWILSLVSALIIIPVIIYNYIQSRFKTNYKDYFLRELTNSIKYTHFIKKYMRCHIWAFSSSLLIYLANATSLFMMIGFSENKNMPIAILNLVYIIIVISFFLINRYNIGLKRSKIVSGFLLNKEMSDTLYNDIKDELCKHDMGDYKIVFTFEKTFDIYVNKEKGTYYITVGSMALQLFSKKEFNAYVIHELIRFESIPSKYDAVIINLSYIIRGISCPYLTNYDTLHILGTEYLKYNFSVYDSSCYYYRGICAALVLKDWGYEEDVLSFYAKYTLMKLSNYFYFDEDKFVELNKDIGTTIVNACETFYNKNKSFLRYCLLNADAEPFDFDLFYRNAADLYDNYELKVDFTDKAYLEFSKELGKQFESPNSDEEIRKYKIDCEQAIKECEEIVYNEDASLDALLELSTRTFDLYLYKWTLKICDIILKIDPNCDRALFQKGRLLLRYENDATGLDYLNRIPTDAILGSSALSEARRYCAIIGDNERANEYFDKITDNISKLDELHEALTINRNDVLTIASKDDEGVKGVIDIAKASNSVFAVTCGVKTVGGVSITFVVLYLYDKVDEETAEKLSTKVFHFLDSLQGQYNLELREYDEFLMYTSDKDCVVLKKEETEID